MQVASCSRAGSRNSNPYVRPCTSDHRPSSIPIGSANHDPRVSRIERTHHAAPANPPATGLRGGEAQTRLNPYAARDTLRGRPTERSPPESPNDTVVVSPPPRATTHAHKEHVDITKSMAAARRNLTRNINKKAQASFAREMKESLASGRPVTLKVTEGQNDLKARWHAAAKEVAYRLLDLRKDNWKDYTIFDKSRVHNELNAKYQFDPPLDPKRVDKYLAGHLRTSRGVWKAHWLKHGDYQRHHNCPEEAWEKLIKWWPTEACMHESQAMASRRSLVQNVSKSGRNSLLERMDEEVRQ